MSNPASRKSSGKGPAYPSPSSRGKKKQIDLKAVGAKLTGASKTIASISIAHPVIIAMGLMTVTQIAKMLVLSSMDPKKLTFTGGAALGRGSHYTPPTSSRQDVVFTELQGLYDASANLATGLVAVPLISAGTNIAGSLLTAKSGS